ncbi:CDP-glycerol glycerophosphotransferase family protein [Aliiglaciecola lipolytica]|uniref:CDP-glycerol glycerophosphotransferase n=1 Tax=Aliiglaciecola lipolytica E3 TaxID=1127673 RepID=K6YF06_9ALTE|nr:CDP-glycerol glycerophosphotransferase family protein [Aliiglaciecola lipolytica]GAC15218.1 CDP-glycerol glycerophosphotransferase [Aliiglaciecola lipolytica E3]
MSLELEIGKRDVWIFGSRKGQFYDDNSKYLFQYILKYKPEIYPVWVTKNPAVFEKLNYENLPVALAGTPRSDAIMSLAKCAFINIIQLDVDKTKLKKETQVVQLWHGTPMKFNDISQFKERYDLVSLASTLFLNEQALGPHHLFDFQVTGYPRNDFLLNDDLPSFVDKQTLEKLRNKKVISFLPTYNEEKDETKSGDKRGKSYAIWQGLDLTKLNQILEQNNAIFVIKLHPLQSPSGCEVQQALEHCNNVLIIDPLDPFADVYQYLKYTDVMITDYSSVLFDYLLLNKPVIFSCFDLDTFILKRNLRFDYNQITPGKKTSNWSEVLEQIQHIFEYGGDGFDKQRQEVCKTFNFYQDSQSCERIYQLAKKLPIDSSKNL